ncbi:Endonuclease/exonuclease/phosphatase superfamily [Sesbania bispinosa]|nr:Endonuclease/exonuclease/phosphatase superfamily [Sesbania bispinosa]
MVVRRRHPQGRSGERQLTATLTLRRRAKNQRMMDCMEIGFLLQAQKKPLKNRNKSGVNHETQLEYIKGKGDSNHGQKISGSGINKFSELCSHEPQDMSRTPSFLYKTPDPDGSDTVKSKGKFNNTTDQKGEAMEESSVQRGNNELVGATNKRGQRHIRDLLNKCKPDLIFIMETHIAFSSTLWFWNGVGYMELAIEDPNRHAGGLWAIIPSSSPFLLSCSGWVFTSYFNPSAGNSRWVYTGCYARPTVTLRRQLWHHLASLRKTFHYPWALIGDFNDILFSHEQHGGSFSLFSSTDFSEMLNACELMDLGCVGMNLHGRGVVMGVNSFQDGWIEV